MPPKSPYAERLAFFRNTFRLYDTDGDGKVTAAEMKGAMADLGYPATDDQARAMIASYDRDGDGQVDLFEFLADQLRVLSGEPEGLRAAFAALDQDRDGQATHAELRAALPLLWAGGLLPVQVEEAIGALDPAGAGKVPLATLLDHLLG